MGSIIGSRKDKRKAPEAPKRDPNKTYIFLTGISGSGKSVFTTALAPVPEGQPPPANETQQLQLARSKERLSLCHFLYNSSIDPILYHFKAKSIADDDKQSQKIFNLVQRLDALFAGDNNVNNPTFPSFKISEESLATVEKLCRRLQKRMVKEFDAPCTLIEQEHLGEHFYEYWPPVEQDQVMLALEKLPQALQPDYNVTIEDKKIFSRHSYYLTTTECVIDDSISEVIDYGSRGGPWRNKGWHMFNFDVLLGFVRLDFFALPKAEANTPDQQRSDLSTNQLLFFAKHVSLHKKWFADVLHFGLVLTMSDRLERFMHDGTFRQSPHFQDEKFSKPDITVEDLIDHIKQILIDAINPEMPPHLQLNKESNFYLVDARSESMVADCIADINKKVKSIKQVASVAKESNSEEQI